MTIVPVSSPSLRGVFYFFPVVGFLIGLFVLLTLKFFPFSPLLSSFLALSFYVVLTGALHLDGLSDTFDAMAHGKGREKALEIMKDSRLGTFGALALFLHLALKALLYKEILEAGFLVLLPISSSFGRWSPIFLSRFFPPARAEGLGFLTAKEVSGDPYCFFFCTCFVLFLCAFLLPSSLFSFFAVGLLLYLFGKFWERKIGGITGDILGCSVELSETFFLLFTVLIGKL